MSAYNLAVVGITSRNFSRWPAGMQAW